MRLKISLISSCLISVVMLLSFLILLAIIRQKQIEDIASHSINLSKQVVSSPAVRSYLEEQLNAPSRESIEQYLHSLLEGNPYVDELTLIDHFGKIPFRIEQQQVKQNKKTPLRAYLSIQDVISSQKPSLNEESWEYFVPLSLNQNTFWGAMRLRWRPEATWMYFDLLKKGILCVCGGCFIITFIFTYLFLLRSYTSEYSRMVKTLSLISGSDYSQRIDIHSFSRHVSEIGVFLNRLLAEIQTEKKKVAGLDESLRDIEKSYANYRKLLEMKTKELNTCRKEMRQGILILFDLLWCGVVVIDDTYRIHYINEKAERLLRFARFEEDVIVDETLKNCLAPLVRYDTVERIEDLCVWSQTDQQRSVSCRIRATSIPADDHLRLFYLLLNEESGFPRQRDSMYFSERLVIDILARGRSDKETFDSLHSSQQVVGFAIENRFRECLRRIEDFRNLECSQFGQIVPIRLAAWLQKRFEADDLFSENLNIVTMMQEVDITMYVPELCLRELIDSAIFLITYLSGNGNNGAMKTLAVRASVDSRGKPVVTFTIPHISRKDTHNLQDVFGERGRLICESGEEKQLSLDELEHDICVSLYLCIKKIMKIKTDCIYSENKQLATLRFTIEKHIFPTPSSEMPSQAETVQEVRDLVRDYLKRA